MSLESVRVQEIISLLLSSLVEISYNLLKSLLGKNISILPIRIPFLSLVVIHQISSANDSSFEILQALNILFDGVYAKT